MNLSNVIAHMISEMLEDQNEVEIRRNSLAQTIGCVPSQINYVLASRFTPERGYIVESRRGGGGCIRIARIHYDASTPLMHTLGAIGDAVDEKTSRSHLLNLVYMELLSKRDAALMGAAISDRALESVAAEKRDCVRAAILKAMLLTVLQEQ